MEAFYRDWFSAWMRGMGELPEKARAEVFNQCGRACAQPMILPAFQKLLRQADSTDAFFAALNRDMNNVSVQTVEPGRVYDVCYPRCLCPIYEECGVTDGLLCECSRSSLQYVMDELFPARSPQVELLTSVLRGDPQCRLRVSLSIGAQ